MHIHHHHWLHLSDEAGHILPEEMLISQSPSTMTASTSAVSRKKFSSLDPPPGYSELPGDQDDILRTRLAELADVSRAYPHELSAESPLTYIETSPPPVGPKPKLNPFSYFLRSLRS